MNKRLSNSLIGMTDRTINELFVSRNDKVCDFGGSEITGLSSARHRRRHSHLTLLDNNCKEKEFELLRRGVEAERARAYIERRTLSVRESSDIPVSFRLWFKQERGKATPKEHNDTRIRSGSGEIHYHIQRRRKSKRGGDGINTTTNRLFLFGKNQLSSNSIYLLLLLLLFIGNRKRLYLILSF